MKNKKTKILAIGDIHGDTGLVKKLAKKAKEENIDVIIIAGDLTFAEQATENLIGPFLDKNRYVLLIPGNHESEATIDFLTEVYSNTKSIHGKYFKKNNIGIFGAGTADFGIEILGEASIFELLKKSHGKIKDAEKKIMVTHMHPKGSKAEAFGWRGSSAVTKALKKFKPDILITAHIHEASGIEEMIGKTKVINVSRKEKIFEI
jgi:Icc-related predicted phosphoesterase